MLKKTLFILFSSFAALSLGCQSIDKTNTNSVIKITNGANTSGDIPPEFSGNKITETTNSSAPVLSNLSKGTTPTPGIPDPATIGKTPQPKNTPKIPGIPSEEELKRQMNTPASNSKITERKPPVSETNSTKSPTDRPRKVRKPN